MAALQNIRNRAGAAVAIIIGLAMLAFIIGDFSGSGQALFSESRYRVIEAAGEAVSIQDFEARLQDYTEYITTTTGQSSFDEAQTASIRDQVYQQVLSEIIMGKEYKAAGVGVSSDEIFDMVQGSDPHEYVRQLFTDQQTGAFDKTTLLRFLKNMDADETGKQRKFWLNLERDITNQRLAEKYTQMVGKGLYVPSFLAKSDYLENNRILSFTYINHPYSAIADSAVSMTDSEIKAYYNANLSKYKQDASRDFDYVAFPVVASEEDRVALESEIQQLKEDFNTAPDASAYLGLNSDQPMDMFFYGKEELPVQVQPLFDAEPGTMVGPFEEESALKVSKLVKTGMFPDSLRIRQIVLVAPAATNAALAAVRDSAEAIKAQLDKGQSFESLFALHSQKSAGLPADGDMGWLPYGQLPDTLYHLPKGGTMVLQSTQNVFILEVTDMKGATKRVQIATLVKNIEAGTATVQKIYSDASKFAGENTSAESFAKGAAEKKLNIVNCVRVTANDQQVNGITDSPRELIRWAFEAQKEAVSPIFDLGNVYVVAVLKDIHEKGPMSLSEASYNIKQTLIKEKKAALIAPMMTSAGADIATIASRLSLPLDTLKEVNFAAYTLPSIGMEYKVLGTAFALKQGSLSKPIEGTGGVYMIYNNEVKEPAQSQDYSAEKTRLGLSFQNRGNYETYDALVKLSDVVDGRIKFY